MTARVAYADPPYPGCAHLYEDHPDYDGEVNHADLALQLREFDGWCLHTSSQALFFVQSQIFRATGMRPSDPWGGKPGDYRVMAWVKPFAAFKRNVSVAYAWEPVLVKACRKPTVSGRVVMRDWLAVRTEECSQAELDVMAESITLKRGLTGAKPERLCRWLFEVLGMEPEDELIDLFPGTGAVARAWESWRSQLSLLTEEVVGRRTRDG